MRGEPMVDLRINQQSGQIALKYTPLQYRLDIRQPDLKIEQKPAEIFSEQPAATIEIDYTPARESLGYVGITTQMKNFVEESKVEYLAGLERIVAEGNQLGSIEKEISVADVVKQATEPSEKELVLDQTKPVKVHVTVNPPRWGADVRGVTSSFTPGDVLGDLTFGKVNTYLEREPFIRMYTVGNVVDAKR